MGFSLIRINQNGTLVARYWTPMLETYIIRSITSRTSTCACCGRAWPAGASVRQGPFVGQIPRISQLAPVVIPTVLRRPHRGLSLESGHHFSITNDSLD